MRNFILCIISLTILVSCKSGTEDSDKANTKFEDTTYSSYGSMIIADGAFSAAEMLRHYKTMVAGDSLNSKMKAKVDEVCQVKGCWMKLNLEDGNQVMVRFKDYGFFMPKDIAGKEVIIHGKAFVRETSIDEQRHYAEDSGKSDQEIAAITKAKRTFAFEADGVLLKQ